MADLIPISTDAQLDPALEAGVAVVFKHSPSCFSSARALTQMRRFAEAHPGVPVYLIDVIRSRQLARQVADRLDVRHESPQVILLRGGDPVWNASHGRVTADALAEASERVVNG